MEKFSPHPPKYLMKNNPPKAPPAQLGAVQWSWAGETSLLCRYFFSPGAAAVPSSLTKEFISSIIPQKVEQLLLHSSLISLALLSIGSLQTFLSLNGWFVVTTWMESIEKLQRAPIWEPLAQRTGSCWIVELWALNSCSQDEPGKGGNAQREELDRAAVSREEMGILSLFPAFYLCGFGVSLVLCRSLGCRCCCSGRWQWQEC